MFDVVCLESLSYSLRTCYVYVSIVNRWIRQQVIMLFGLFSNFFFLNIQYLFSIINSISIDKVFFGDIFSGMRSSRFSAVANIEF